MHYKLAFYKYQARIILYPKDADAAEMDISNHLLETYRTRGFSKPSKVVLVDVPDTLRKRIEERKNPRGGLYFIWHGTRSNIVSPIFLSQREVKSYVKEHGLSLGNDGYYITRFRLWYQPFW